jgi:hypothetical protein
MAMAAFVAHGVLISKSSSAFVAVSVFMSSTPPPLAAAATVVVLALLSAPSIPAAIGGARCVAAVVLAVSSLSFGRFVHDVPQLLASFNFARSVRCG